MSFEAKVFNVMIASPGDVAAERVAVREIVLQWNVVNATYRRTVLLPIGWETHSTPAVGKHPQRLINDQLLSGADLLVGIFWTRLGTATDDYASGTVEEVEEHVKAGRPAMLYFSSAPVRIDSVEPKQWEALQGFKESWRTRGLFEEFEDAASFREKFARQLQLKVNNDPHFAVAGAADARLATIPSPPFVSREAAALLKAASEDKHGFIHRNLTLAGLQISSHGVSFVEQRNPRSEATWDGAIDELEAEGLIQTVDRERNGFRVTRRGYEVAETIFA